MSLEELYLGCCLDLLMGWYKTMASCTRRPRKFFKSCCSLHGKELPEDRLFQILRRKMELVAKYCLAAWGFIKRIN